MTEVKLPNGEEKPLREIISSLSNDNIVITKQDPETLTYLNRYFNSDITKKIVANRYKDLDTIKNYFNTKLSDIINENFIEKWLPHVVNSTSAINEAIVNNKKILLVSDYDVD